MRDVLILLVHLIVTLIRLARPGGIRAVVAESVLVKHQLVILNRSRKRAPNLHALDRIIAGLCALLMHPARVVRCAIVLRPSTLLHFHHILVKGKAAARIAQQITLTFGIEINKDVVRRVLGTHYHPELNSGGPSWLTSIAHMKDSLWSVDLFRCESAALQTYWVLVVMDQFTRRIVGFGIQRGIVDGLALCRMFNQAIQGHALPKYVSSDHDPLYRFHQWQANLRVLEVTEIKTVPYVPLSHPFVERLIGTIRRECLDQTLFWTAADLEDKLFDFQHYFNAHRTHVGLDGRTPELRIDAGRSAANLSRYTWQRHCRGLYQTPAAA
jgi:putative transposase